MDSGVITLGIVLGILFVSFGVVALRAWLESRRVQSIREVVNALVADPVFRRELKKALIREHVLREACEELIGRKRKHIKPTTSK